MQAFIAAWALAEISLSAYDVHSTIGVLGDENATGKEKITSAGLTVAGFALPGAGYGKIDDVARSYKNLQRISKNAKWGNTASLVKHTIDHSADFGLRATDFAGYARAANNFLSKADDAIRQGNKNFDSFIDKKGRTYFFDKKTSTLGIRNADGTSATAFKPKGGDSKKASSYWSKQKAKHQSNK